MNQKFNECVPELRAFDQETLYKRQSTGHEEKLQDIQKMIQI